MRRASEKSFLTTEQLHQKELDNWKIRRILRLTQTRDQAKHAACMLRVDFWTEVDCIAEDMSRMEAEKRQIEEELKRKRTAAAEERQRQEELRCMADQKKAENELREEKRRLAEEYAERTRKRFNAQSIKSINPINSIKSIKSINPIKSINSIKPIKSINPINSIKSIKSIKLIEVSGREEAEKIRKNSVPEIRKTFLPETENLFFERRNSMLPRKKLPQPTFFFLPEKTQNETLFNSPLSNGGGLKHLGENSPEKTEAVFRPRPQKTPKEIQKTEIVSSKKQKKKSENEKKEEEEIDENSTADRNGSVFDLGGENLEPVRGPLGGPMVQGPVSSPWSYSRQSVASLGGRRMESVPSADVSPRTKSVAISAQSSFGTVSSFSASSSSSSSEENSYRTQDSESLHAIFQHPAIQFSPPKHPPHPPHPPHSHGPSEELQRPQRPREEPRERQRPLTDQATPSPCRSLSPVVILPPRRPLREMGNILPPPDNENTKITKHEKHENLENQKNHKKHENLETRKTQKTRRPNPADLLADLHEVMRALEILDANVVGVNQLNSLNSLNSFNTFDAFDTFNSFTTSVSSGPLSVTEGRASADSRNLGNSGDSGDSVEESWMSQQTLSTESSFQSSHVTLESGTLFTSFSSTNRSFNANKCRDFSMLSQGGM